MRRPVSDRFWEKVQRTDSCWLWTAKNNGKYGQFYFRGRYEGAHRASWILHFDIIPRPLEVCHTCDNPLCVRPSHLFVGTRAQNMQDCVRKGRFNKPNGEAVWSAKLTEDQVLTVRQRRAAGEKMRTIAAELGITMRLTRCALDKWQHLPAFGLVELQFPTQGERNGHAILTEPQVLALRADAAAGMKRRELAAKYGVTGSAAYRAARGLSWAHLSP